MLCYLVMCDSFLLQGIDRWVWKIHWRKAWQPTPVLLPEESPWAKEPGGLQSIVLQGSDMIEWFTAHTWTVAYQAPLSMELSRQEYWNGLHVLLQGIFLIQGLNPNILNLLHCRQILYLWVPVEALRNKIISVKFFLLKIFEKIDRQRDSIVSHDSIFWWIFLKNLFSYANFLKEALCLSLFNLQKKSSQNIRIQKWYSPFLKF